MSNFSATLEGDQRSPPQSPQVPIHRGGREHCDASPRTLMSNREAFHWHTTANLLERVSIAASLASCLLAARQGCRAVQVCSYLVTEPSNVSIKHKDPMLKLT